MEKICKNCSYCHISVSLFDGMITDWHCELNDFVHYKTQGIDKTCDYWKSSDNERK